MKIAQMMKLTGHLNWDVDHGTLIILPDAESISHESMMGVPVKEPVKRTQVPAIRTHRERPIKPKHPD